MDADASPTPSKAGAPRHVRVGCVVCGLGGVMVVGLLLIIAVPNYVSLAIRAKRAELPHTVDQIRTAQLAHREAFGGFVACGNEADTRARFVGDVGKQMRDFNPDGDPCWDALGWSPEGPLRGAYWVEVTADGTDFTVTGISDVDGDGACTSFVATRDSAARMVSSKYVY